MEKEQLVPSSTGGLQVKFNMCDYQVIYVYSIFPRLYWAFSHYNQTSILFYCHCGDRCYQQGHKGARKICVQQINTWTWKGLACSDLSRLSSTTDRHTG